MSNIQSKGHVLLLVAAISALASSTAVAQTTLRIGGTGAINETVRSLAPAFLAATGIDLQLIPSMGTNGGNSAVADGVLDICISGRPLNQTEISKGLISVASFRTPFGMASSHPNPIAFKSLEIAQLYQSDKPLWSDGTPIRVILRPTNESDTQVLGQMFPGMAAAISKVRNRADLTVAATDQDNAEMAEKTAGSLVGITFTQVKMERRDVRFAAIDGVEPSLENFEKGIYPFGKTMHVVVGPKPNAAAQRFATFLRTPEGATALRTAGILLSVE